MDVIVLTKNVKVVHNASQMPSTVILSALNEAGLQASIGRKGEESSKCRCASMSSLVLSYVLNSC